MPRPVRRTAVATALTLVLGLGAAGCSGDDEPPEADPGSPADSAAPAERTVTTQVSFGRLTGRLDRATRQRLSRQVRDVVDGWTRAAYLGGDYPRGGSARAWTGSWPGFTRGAQAQALRDRALTSNQDIADRIDGVQPRRSVVALDVLAVRGRPTAVTARTVLRFTTTGDLERTVVVRGRLFLTRTGGHWRVFGYDISKGAV